MSVAKAKKISENTPLQHISTHSTYLWTIFLFAGYLTKEREINPTTSKST
jgi:hypothetical protein